MTDHPAGKTVAQTAGPQEGGQIAEQERRRTVRYVLVANAEAEDVANGLCLAARTSDISVHGCYLDTMNPFPHGARIRIHITKGHETFHSLGVVMYAHAGMGMGVAFTELDSAARQVLQDWIAELESGRISEVNSDAARVRIPEISEQDSAIFRIERLVRMLETKGLLTEEEAQEILGSIQF